MHTENLNLDLLDIEGELNHITETDINAATANTCKVNDQRMNIAFGTVC
jgi:hypothetical protein